MVEELQNNHCSIESECTMESPANGGSAKLPEKFIKDTLCSIFFSLFSLNYCTWAREKIYQCYKKAFKQQIIFKVLNLWKCILSLSKKRSGEFMLNFTL